MKNKQYFFKYGLMFLHVEASCCMNLELKVETWDGKFFFTYTHANKTQKFDHKMNVI